VVQWVKNPLSAATVTAEVWVQSPAQHSGSKDPAWSQLRLRFTPSPRNSHLPWLRLGGGGIGRKRITRHKNPLIFKTQIFDRRTLIFFLLFSFLATPWHMEFPGQGSDQSHSFDLRHSCGNTKSLTHCAGPGIEPTIQHSRNAAELLSSYI